MGESNLLESLASEGKSILLESLGASAASLDSTAASQPQVASEHVCAACPPAQACSPGIVGQHPICPLSPSVAACLALEEGLEALTGDLSEVRASEVAPYMLLFQGEPQDIRCPSRPLFPWGSLGNNNKNPRKADILRTWDCVCGCQPVDLSRHGGL